MSDDNARLVHYFTNSGNHRTALVRDCPGDKNKLRVVIMDSPIDVTRVARTEERWMENIENPNLQHAAKWFRAAGKRLGITPNAKRFLRGL